MAFHKIEQFLEETVSYVKFILDRGEIKQELKKFELWIARRKL